MAWTEAVSYERNRLFFSNGFPSIWIVKIFFMGLHSYKESFKIISFFHALFVTGWKMKDFNCKYCRGPLKLITAVIPMYSHPISYEYFPKQWPLIDYLWRTKPKSRNQNNWKSHIYLPSLFVTLTCLHNSISRYRQTYAKR